MLAIIPLTNDKDKLHTEEMFELSNTNGISATISQIQTNLQTLVVHFQVELRQLFWEQIRDP